MGNRKGARGWTGQTERDNLFGEPRVRLVSAGDNNAACSIVKIDFITLLYSNIYDFMIEFG